MANIITLEQYKEYKKINSTNSDDKLGAIIGSVNKFVENYCQRSFTDHYSSPKTEYFDGYNNNGIYPSEFPLVSVVSLKSSTDGGQSYDVTLQPFIDYQIDNNAYRILSTKANFVTTLYPINSLQLIYKAGYSSVPEDLRLAAMSLVEYYMEEQYTPKKGMQGTNVENVLYTSESSKLPPHIRRILDFYRSMSL